VSYDRHLQHMTRGLFDLARRGQSDLSAADVDIALTARRSVLELLTAVHTDTTGLSPARGVARIGDLEAHPVAVLGQALARHPRPVLDEAPTDVLGRATETATGETWRHIARDALLAGHHWSAGRGLVTDEATAWKSIADVAASAGLLVALDPPLADVIDRVAPDRQNVVASLRLGNTSGVGVSARESARLSAAGPIASAGPNRSATPAACPRVLVARSVADLPVTHHRLAALLGAVPLRAERVPALATAIARCCLRVHDGIATDDPAWAVVRQTLQEHARLLQRATLRPGGIISNPAAMGLPPGAETGPEPALRQASEAHRSLMHLGPPTACTGRLLRDYVHALASSTRALSEAVDQAIAARHWVVPDPEAPPEGPAWKTLRPTASPPSSVTALRAAAAHAETLSAAARAAMTPGGDGAAATRDRLTSTPEAGPAPSATSAGLLSDDLTAQRPRLPSHPVVASPVRRR
jgi:hypothetical protein